VHSLPEFVDYGKIHPDKLDASINAAPRPI